ncbi:leucine rich repeat [Seminavis robusta]|uniref:Leucine rich repeat n=1 Tax=Seminavis robusta TaxID=568900 RepID=A0A9N8ES30_9STRA|nr:leucine rich repeat [Seminavis robusta]|eukprot:Sro1541_g280920.1 leucine rich repeat (436) ;mRNA; r:14809-16324
MAEEEAKEVVEDSKEASGAEAPAAENEGGTGAPVENGETNSSGNRAQLAEFPMEWTQMGQCDAANAPANVIRYPSDVGEISKEDTEIMIVGTAGQKITRIGQQFHETASPELTRLILRSHLIKSMEGLEGFKHLQLLELYDNMVEELKNLNDGEDGTPGSTLTVLDMSYNVIRDMDPVSFCPNLTELYLANNKLKTMAGLKGLSKLRKIDLGANRIRIMDAEELSGLVSLEELWLGKNKIEKIEGLENLKNLRRLDVQSNRITQVENLTSQNDTLEELFLGHNGITSEGITLESGLAQAFPNLNVLDLSRNRIISTAPLAHLTSLEELWLSGNKIASFTDVEPLSALGSHGLDTVYLEYNPVADEFEYRKKLAEFIPSLKQIDATMIGGLAHHGIPGVARSGGTAETVEEQMRRLQGAAIARAKKQTEEQKKNSE